MPRWTYPPPANPSIPAWLHCVVCDRPRVWNGAAFVCRNVGYCPRGEAVPAGEPQHWPVLTRPELDAVRFAQEVAS